MEEGDEYQECRQSPDDQLELNVCDLDQNAQAPNQGLTERESWIVHSRASQTVARRSSLPDAIVRESPGSKRGPTYKGPGSDISPMRVSLLP